MTKKTAQDEFNELNESITVLQLEIFEKLDKVLRRQLIILRLKTLLFQLMIILCAVLLVITVSRVIR